MITYLLVTPVSESERMTSYSAAKGIYTDEQWAIFLWTLSAPEDAATLETLTGDTSLHLASVLLPDVAVPIVLQAVQPVAQAAPVEQSVTSPDALEAQALSLEDALFRLQ